LNADSLRMFRTLTILTELKGTASQFNIHPTFLQSRQPDSDCPTGSTA
jgi:hypothetical protein